MLSLVLGVGAFEVASALVVMVTEKRRAFGVLLALGGPPSLVRRTLLLAGATLGGAGVVTGVALGVLVALVLTALGVPRFPPDIASIYMVDTIPLRLLPGDLAAVLGLSMIEVVLASTAAREPGLASGAGRGAAVGLNDGMLWEVQWHPGGGGSVRRLVLTRRGLRRTLIGLGFAGLLVLVVVSALPVGLKGLLTSFTVDAAKRENHALKVQGDSLREQTLAAAEPRLRHHPARPSRGLGARSRESSVGRDLPRAASRG